MRGLMISVFALIAAAAASGCASLGTADAIADRAGTAIRLAQCVDDAVDEARRQEAERVVSAAAAAEAATK